MVGDAAEHVLEPRLGVDVVQLGRRDQRVDCGCPLAPAVGASGQPTASAEGDAAQRSFGAIVGQADPAVVEEVGEGGTALEQVIHRLGDVVVSGEPGRS